jgi:hypothetical protein
MENKFWTVPRLWEGGECWIIGGGESIAKEFKIPDSLVQQVISGKKQPNVYSPYLSPIHNKHVIGINVAYKIGNWMDFIFFGDGSFFTNYFRELAKHPSIKVCCDPKAINLARSIKDQDKWLRFVNRSRKKYGITTKGSEVCWNENSGCAAINFAVNLGCKRIILLGFDMKLSANKQQHWHDAYNRQAKINQKDGKKYKAVISTFDRHMKGMRAIKLCANKLGVKVINASPDSAIKEFEKISVNELLK